MQFRLSRILQKKIKKYQKSVHFFGKNASIRLKDAERRMIWIKVMSAF